MKENSIEKTLENIQNVDLITLLRKFKKEGVENFIVIRRNDYDEILSDYKRVLKENEELKNKIMEKDLEIIGKEEYTKASMGEIIEQYYTANEDCITKQKIEKLIEELKQDDINMTRKYKEKKNITGELLGIDKVRVRAYREKTREIKEKLQKLLSDWEKGK